MRAPSWIRFLLLGMMAAVAAAGALVLFALLRDPGTSQALIPLPVQPFAADALGGISTNQLNVSIGSNYTVTQALQGERTTIPGIFSGPGFSLDLDKDMTNGTQVGTVWSSVDAGCNGIVDYMADDPIYPGGPAPNPPFEPWLSPLTWSEATTAVEGTPDEFLKAIMPPFSWLVRHKVDIDHLCIDVWGGTVVFPSVLNTVYAAIPYSPNGSTFVAQTKLGGSPTTPPSSVCLDSPQSSESVTTVYNTPPNEGDIDGVCNQGTQACADAGIYGMWTDNTVALANGGSTTIEVEKHKVNNGPEAGVFEELWEVESTNAGITAEWVPGGPVFAEDIELPAGVPVEQHKNLSITCTAPANNQWGLVVVKNLLSPIPPTEDTYLDDNAMVFVVLVKCGVPATTPEVDKEVSLIKANPSHIAPTTPGVPVLVLIDELKANHGTTDVLGNEWLVAEVGDVDAEPGPDLILSWAPGVTVTAPGHDTQTPAVTYCVSSDPTCIRFLVNEWPGQADVNAQLNIACPATTPPGLYPVVVKAIDVPVGAFESKSSDNAQRKVITVRCGGAADDGIVDGNGLYPRWTILQSMGSTSLNKSGDLRKDYMSPPSIPSDTGYVERIIDLQCFWMDDDGCDTCDADSSGYLSEVETWNDPDLLAMGGIGTVDPDGDCLVSAAYAQPGHPVDLPTISGTCDPLQYSEYPMAVTYSKAKDADCDGLVDGIEKAWGANPLLADSDGDGAPDFVEMFQFTSPVNPDTDGDGLLDRPDDDYIAAAAGSAESGEAMNADDNCPSVYNPDQLNSDGRGRWNGAVPNDYASNPNKDKMGDACDDDDDNDGATDAYESAQGTNPLKLDTDGDTVNDGAELRLGTNPNNPGPLWPVWGAAQQVYYRGCHINVPAQGAYPAWDAEYDGLEDGVENDVDGDGTICQSGGSIVDADSDNGTGTGVADPETGSNCDNADDDDGDGRVNDGCPQVGAAKETVCNETVCPDADGVAPWDTCDNDADGKINDGCQAIDATAEIWDKVEAFGYNTSIANKDSDGDGCEDWIEIVDVNGNRSAEILDAWAVAKPLLPSDVLDIDKSGVPGGAGDVNLAVSNSQLVKAHAACGPSPQAGPPNFRLSIDANKDAGDTWCDPVDTQAAAEVGGTYQVAICVENPPAAIGAFQAEVTYDASLSFAPEISCPFGTCLDDNPDANEGATKWGQGLGGNWDCNVQDLSEPTGDAGPPTGPGQKRARIACWSLAGPYTLGTTGALAVLTLQATAPGTQELELGNVIVGDGNGVERGSCNPALGVSVPCEGAAVTGVLAPTPTPTATPTGPTPTPTATPTPNIDTDGDTVLDHMDNCPLVYNPDQTNTDGQRRPNGPQIPGEWASNPSQDKLGDACDPDADNDALPDSQEFDDHCPYRLVADSDGDGALDGFEVANGFDPCNAASKPTWTGGSDSDGDSLLDGTERGGYNTCAFTGDTTPGWATCAVPQDSDGDSCADTLEALDLNGDRFVDSGDRGLLNKRVAGKIAADPVSDSIFDLNKDGFIDSGDQGLMNRSNCMRNPNQLGCPMCPAE